MSEMSEKYIEIKTSDTKYSKSECLKYQGVSIFNDITKEPCHGEYNTDEFTTRFKNGLLHGGVTSEGNTLPAYETSDGHLEFFENGLLHRDNAPAIISHWGEWEEWWSHGSLVLIKSTGSIDFHLEKKG